MDPGIQYGTVLAESRKKQELPSYAPRGLTVEIIVWLSFLFMFLQPLKWFGFHILFRTLIHSFGTFIRLAFHKYKYHSIGSASIRSSTLSLSFSRFHLAPSPTMADCSQQRCTPNHTLLSSNWLTRRDLRCHLS